MLKEYHFGWRKIMTSVLKVEFKVPLSHSREISSRQKNAQKKDLGWIYKNV